MKAIDATRYVTALKDAGFKPQQPNTPAGKARTDRALMQGAFIDRYGYTAGILADECWQLSAADLAPSKHVTFSHLRERRDAFTFDLRAAKAKEYTMEYLERFAKHASNVIADFRERAETDSMASLIAWRGKDALCAEQELRFARGLEKRISEGGLEALETAREYFTDAILRHGPSESTCLIRREESTQELRAMKQALETINVMIATRDADYR